MDLGDIDVMLSNQGQKCDPMYEEGLQICVNKSLRFFTVTLFNKHSKGWPTMFGVIMFVLKNYQGDVAFLINGENPYLVRDQKGITLDQTQLWTEVELGVLGEVKFAKLPVV